MKGHCHLIGIGGIGMSAIAQLLLRRGLPVSGCDLKESAITADLRQKGARVFIGHDAAHIDGVDTVVYSSAIRKDSPELAAAVSSGTVRILKRAEALALLMQERSVVTVSGSHGKTTTASLAACLLLEAGFAPTVAVGGILRNIDTNACLGEGDFFVAEADESDGSFLCYRPHYSIITNIDFEHMDYYQDFEGEVAAFREFISHTRQEGCVFACQDDRTLRELVETSGRRHVFFGLHDDADAHAANISVNGLSSEFDFFLRKEFIDRFSLSLGGMHNVSNALAVIALGLELGIGKEQIKKTLRGFRGAHRRLEIKYQDQEYTVIDDYAHHPTEIKATLAAVRNLNSARVVAVFQPHRYTRTQLLLEEFAGCFNGADVLMVTDIYAAGEPPIGGVDAGALCEKIRFRNPGKEVHYVAREQIIAQVLKIIKPGDLVIMLGAGDIIKVCEEFAQGLSKDRWSCKKS
ncbi:MAG: UDP-N-acetylmuramate--L-alanine ligase [Candidatus Omnitrophica bacterium]|nr:UDP-N-acetylmuramate--L-alanine ligase [Candidatus Omnitrophota bacterium]